MASRGPLTERAANEALDAKIHAAKLVTYIEHALADGEFSPDEARAAERMARRTYHEVVEAHFWSEESNKAVLGGMAVMRGAALMPSKNTRPTLKDAHLEVCDDEPVPLFGDDENDTAA